VPDQQAVILKNPLGSEQFGTVAHQCIRHAPLAKDQADDLSADPVDRQLIAVIDFLKQHEAAVACKRLQAFRTLPPFRRRRFSLWARSRRRPIFGNPPERHRRRGWFHSVRALPQRRG
jgi:hypothetical protein